MHSPRYDFHNDYKFDVVESFIFVRMSLFRYHWLTA